MSGGESKAPEDKDGLGHLVLTEHGHVWTCVALGPGRVAR